MAIQASVPTETSAVIIGGGPSSLILSYILHGHIPYYYGRHRDALLHEKLSRLPNLLHITPEVWSHFASDMHYSSQALPINTLLDTLIRPGADTELNPKSCVEWVFEPERSVSHFILASSHTTGGQWSRLEGSEIDKLATLSYADMLSLPGYGFADYYHENKRVPLPDFHRPSRIDVSQYYATYPSAVGISDALRMNDRVEFITREQEWFIIQPQNIVCKRVVLATGTFDNFIAPPYPMSLVGKTDNPQLPVIIVGSGYSAADAIMACPSHINVIHIYKWDPIKKPSPLKGCHQQAYPGYAGIYRLMKAAAVGEPRRSAGRRSHVFGAFRNWDTTYQGLPNSVIEDVHVHDNYTVVTIRSVDGNTTSFAVGSLLCLLGRHGSLKYLDRQLKSEVLPNISNESALLKEEYNVSRQTLRAKAEIDTEIGSSVFIIGSLTGDTLVRHAFGACVYAASRIFGINNSKITRN